MIVQADIERIPLADNSVDLIWTDPPYPREYLPCYFWLAQEAMRVLKPGGFVAAMCGGSYLPSIYAMFEYSNLDYFYECSHKTTGNAPVVYRHNSHDGGYPIIARAKPIILYSKGPSHPVAGNLLNLFEPTTWEGKTYHNWGQDVESARYYIQVLSNPGDLVLDPFIGGGTTGVACELIGRRWIGCDLDPVACRTSYDRLAGAEIPYAMPLFDRATE